MGKRDRSATSTATKGAFRHRDLRAYARGSPAGLEAKQGSDGPEETVSRIEQTADFAFANSIILATTLCGDTQDTTCEIAEGSANVRVTETLRSALK
jgi:hypothetical protein